MSANDDPFREQQVVWKEKPALRTLYSDFQERLMASARGRVLEIGAGSGCLKQSARWGDHHVTLDRHTLAQADVIADAHAIPFESETFDSVIMVDVFHHLQNPVGFLREASRVLRRGGIVGMIEPGISAVSGLFYRLFHDEPVVMTENPFAAHPFDANWGPFDANQAVPTLMFERADSNEQLESAGVAFRVVRCDWLSLFAYPLSGGFRRWQLIPNFLVRPVLRLERRLIPFLGPIAAFRLHVVLERIDAE